MTPVPDVPHWIEGWRLWRQYDGTLLSWTTEISWLPHQALEASCCPTINGLVDDAHGNAPSTSCSCGIYFKHQPPPWADVPSHESDFVIGRVAVWGKVIKGTEGGRAQFAYPLSLSDRKLAKQYGVAWERQFRQRASRMAWAFRGLYGVGALFWATMPFAFEYSTTAQWVTWWFNQVLYLTMSYVVWKEPRV